MSSYSSAPGPNLEAATETLKILTYELMGLPSAGLAMESLFLELGESLMCEIPAIISRAFQAALDAAAQKQPVSSLCCQGCTHLCHLGVLKVIYACNVSRHSVKLIPYNS